VQQCSHRYEDALILTGSVIGFLALTGVFIGAMLHLYHKHKKLRFRYDQLLMQQGQNQPQQSIEPNSYELETL